MLSQAKRFTIAEYHRLDKLQIERSKILSNLT
jgi:hypothetical protein